MEFRTFWTGSLLIFILPDLTSGLKCFACNGVLHLQECNNVTDCTVGEICSVQETWEGYKLGCMSKNLCEILAHVTLTNVCADCCENEAFCNSKLCGLNVTMTTTMGQSKETTTMGQSKETTTMGQSKETTTMAQSKETTSMSQSKETTTMAQSTVATTTMTKSTVITTPIATTTELDLAPPLINGTMLLGVHSNGRLDCASGRNDVKFTWQFNGTSSIPQHAHVVGNHLLIINMTESEVGMYTCIISNLGTTAQASAWLSMNTVYTTLPTSTVTDLSPPHISGQILINLNADTILACNSDEPGVKYTWLYQGSKTLPPGVATFAENHLVIVGANSSNVGTFACVIDKNRIQAVSYTTVAIIPTKAHVALVVASPNHPRTHYRVDIHCTVTGYPDPDIYWSYTDTMGLSYVPINASYPDRATVRIDDFEPSLHSGTWSCIARNSLGVDRDFVQI